MIDTHCHIDLYDNPIAIAKASEKLGITTIGMTNLPSHFELGFKHLLSYKRVRLALGLHPLHAAFHEEELPRFIKNISYTSYIGEVGLDFSKEGIETKDIQYKSFTTILSALSGKRKILSLHSRGAESQVLNLLVSHSIKLAIFHWYSGPVPLIKKIAGAGFYFSINPAMIRSKSGQKIIQAIPQELVLTESDGPFVEVGGRAATPRDVTLVTNYLSQAWAIEASKVEGIINQNFFRLIQGLK
jgi:TatD DNase family protein